MEEEKCFATVDFSVRETVFFNILLDRFKTFLKDARINEEIREEHYQELLDEFEEYKLQFNELKNELEKELVEGKTDLKPIGLLNDTPGSKK
ncbi:hypothetical protein [Orenia marismortui]|uniref:Uncharacterized protein n=1 Tax=Orenia marismortui TaxID=46469 RepID=A0A4V3GYE0_9FIRM|nr:hypothetical protein [Orenia marismortui]TDX52150.1 hypothetical protein C7959_10872 [Orenia marismortui]